MGVLEDLSHARETFERGDWRGAHEAWSALDTGQLTTADLVHAGTAAYLLGERQESQRLLQRAFDALEAQDEVAAAVRVAFQVAMTYATGGEPGHFAGWVARAERLVERLGTDTPEAGYVAFLHMFACLGTGDLAGASGHADATAAAGRRHHDDDLVSLGLCSQGRLAVYSGRVREGIRHLDEAMVQVASGQVSPVIAGHVYCTAIEGCQELGELGRVVEWTGVLHRWCAEQPGLVAFTGQCAVHRGQVMQLRGAFSDAVEELGRACIRYRASGSLDAVGLAAFERGDALRVLGDLDTAEESYREAAEHGYDPQPGLALLWLARGRVAAAEGAVRRVLAETPGPVQRLRVLPAAVEVLLAAGELAAAREAATELEGLAADIGSTVPRARAAHASGAVELADDDARGALPYLRMAVLLWTTVGAPYEAARARVLIGEACARLGDTESAGQHLRSALDTFTAQGASLDAAAVRARLQPSVAPGGLSRREVEVLRLVAGGRSNAQIAAELVLSEKTVARHLSNIFTKLDVPSRTAAAAFAFENGLA